MQFVQLIYAVPLFLCHLFGIAFLFLKSGLLLNSIVYSIFKSERILPKLARSLTTFLTSAGPAFVKFGQILAIRSDIMGPTLCAHIRTLHDRIPSAQFKKVQLILQNQLGHKLTDLEIDPISYGSASIAQVYKARIKSLDMIIALKVLRPGVRRKFAANLIVLRGFAIAINFLFIKRLKLPEVVKVVREASKIELDMHLEAAAADKLRSQNTSNVHIPQVFWEYCSADILAMEWIDGASGEAILPHLVINQIDSELIARQIAMFFFDQACGHGIFHADIHPGNIMISSSGNVSLVDFGIIGFLKQADRIFITQILYFFLNQNYDKVAELHMRAGYLPKSASKELFALACRSVVEPIMNRSAVEISVSHLLSRLFSITSQFSMETQPQLVLLQKALIGLEATIHFICPTINLWNVAREWFEIWAKANVSTFAKLRNLSLVAHEIEVCFGSWLDNIIEKSISKSQR